MWFGTTVQAFAPLGNGKDLLDDPVLLEIAKKKGKTTAQVRNIPKGFFFNVNMKKSTELKKKSSKIFSWEKSSWVKTWQSQTIGYVTSDLRILLRSNIKTTLPHISNNVLSCPRSAWGGPGRWEWPQSPRLRRFLGRTRTRHKGLGPGTKD